MLSNSLLNAVICTMSQPAQSRKKLVKYPATSSRNSNHKLKRVSSSTTYVVDSEEGRENLETVLSEEPSVISNSDKDSARLNPRIDKTTSSSNFGGRKFWNCNSKPMSNRIPNNAVIKEESELISVLTKQLYLAEAHVQKAQTELKKSANELKSKDQEIGRLKRKVKDWEAKSKNQEILRKKEEQQRRRQTDHSEYLYERCLTLEHRILEMEKFLADYGLIWVGDANNTKPPEAGSNNYIETCYEQIIANIDQLNLAAGKGEVHVQHNEKGNGATFKTPSCLSLRFYKNGMMVQDSPLRSYNDPVTVSFLRDILDGYFPSELQQAYPNGVPFKVEDHRIVMYMGESAGFPGQGYRLGKQPPVDNALLTARTRKSSNTSQRSGRRSPLPKENFSNSEFSATLLPTARSLKPKTSSETPSLEMYILRSQILASHNNICSDTHLQSHINAELGLSSRKEKRDLATKNTDCDLSTREKALKPKGALRFSSANRSYHSSSDRSSAKQSPRLEGIGDRARQRSRSASLSSARLSANSRSTSRPKRSTEFGSIDPLKFPNYSTEHKTSKKGTRATKSATQARMSAPPILHQINEPTGKAGELRLKVRSVNGGTVYLVHVSAEESIAKLYQLLDRAMSRSVPRGYKIVLSGYSPRRLEQLGVTLEESGITRDSVLHLVND